MRKIFGPIQENDIWRILKNRELRERYKDPKSLLCQEVKNTLAQTCLTLRKYQPHLPSHEQHTQRKKTLGRLTPNPSGQWPPYSIRMIRVTRRTEIDGELSWMKQKTTLVLKCHKLINIPIFSLICLLLLSYV